MHLFTPIVAEQAQHRNFRNIYKVGNGFRCDVLMEWAKGFDDRDGKFVKEFQTTFNACFWELYLFAVLKQLHLKVDFSHAAPDFFVENHGGFNIGATVALNAQDTLPEFHTWAEPPPSDFNEFNRQAIVRLSNSVSTKQRKFHESYSKLPHVIDRPFVLAISAFDRPYAQLSCQRAIEALLFGYYVDEEKYLREGGTLKGYQIESVLKDNGAEVRVNLFRDPSFSWLSAVLFSSCATWSKVAALSNDPNPNMEFTALRRNLERDDRRRNRRRSESRDQTKT
jgi:hypothetical protein